MVSLRSPMRPTWSIVGQQRKERWSNSRRLWPSWPDFAGNCCHSSNSMPCKIRLESTDILPRGGAKGTVPLLWRPATNIGDCPNFRVSENGTVPFSAAKLGQSPISQRVLSCRGSLQLPDERCMITEKHLALLIPHIKYSVVPTVVAAISDANGWNEGKVATTYAISD